MNINQYSFKVVKGRLSESAQQIMNSIVEHLPFNEQPSIPLPLHDSAKHKSASSPAKLVEMADAIIERCFSVNSELESQLETVIKNLEDAKTTGQPNEVVTELECELEGLKKSITELLSTEKEKYLAIDDQVGVSENEREKSYENTIVGFTDINIVHSQEGFTKTRRKLVPEKHFAHMLRNVRSWFPGQDVILNINKAGDDGDCIEIVASQHEYMRAFQNSTNRSELDLCMDVILPTSEVTRKRKLEELLDWTDDDESDAGASIDVDARDGIFALNSGPWLNIEVEKFKSGVKHFCWRKWASIAHHIGTRTTEQTRAFSRGRGSRFEPGSAAARLLCANTLAAILKSAVENAGPALANILSE